MLTCRLVEGLHDLAEISEAWDRLVGQSEFNDLYATAGFARAWWRAYGKTRSLRIAVIGDDSSQVRLIAPFYSDISRPLVWKIVGSFSADYSNLIFRRADWRSLDCFRSWLVKNREWHVILLNGVPKESSLCRFHYTWDIGSSLLTNIRSVIRSRPPLVYRRWRWRHPLINRSKLQSLRSMLDAKHYRKHVNWFSRQGTLQYHCILDPREILTHLPDFAKMHTGEWAARGQRSLYTSDESRRFHEYLIEELEPYRAVRLDILTLDHKAIAAHFGFNWNGRVYYYRPCYDHTFEDHSPGRLLLAHIIKRAVEDGASEVDLLGGMEEYKMKLSSDIRATASMQMYRGLESLPYAVLSRLGCLDN